MRVYDTHGGTLLCKLGNEDGSHGKGEGEFCEPWGVAVTADSAYALVVDRGNFRVQLLSLLVSAGDDGTAAQLAFVRVVGGSLYYPAGLALRSVHGRQTVLVSEEQVFVTHTFELLVAKRGGALEAARDEGVAGRVRCDAVAVVVARPAHACGPSNGAVRRGPHRRQDGEICRTRWSVAA